MAARQTLQLPSSVPGHTHPLKLVDMPEPEPANAQAGALNRGLQHVFVGWAQAKPKPKPRPYFTRPSASKLGEGTKSSGLALTWENCSWVGKINALKRIDAWLMFVQSRIIIWELCRLWLPEICCSSPLLGTLLCLYVVQQWRDWPFLYYVCCWMQQCKQQYRIYELPGIYFLTDDHSEWVVYIFYNFIFHDWPWISHR